MCPMGMDLEPCTQPAVCYFSPLRRASGILGTSRLDEDDHGHEPSSLRCLHRPSCSIFQQTLETPKFLALSLLAMWQVSLVKQNLPSLSFPAGRFVLHRPSTSSLAKPSISHASRHRNTEIIGWAEVCAVFADGGSDRGPRVTNML